MQPVSGSTFLDKLKTAVNILLQKDWHWRSSLHTMDGHCSNHLVFRPGSKCCSVAACRADLTPGDGFFTTKGIIW